MHKYASELLTVGTTLYGENWFATVPFVLINNDKFLDYSTRHAISFYLKHLHLDVISLSKTYECF